MPDNHETEQFDVRSNNMLDRKLTLKEFKEKTADRVKLMYHNFLVTEQKKRYRNLSLTSGWVSWVYLAVLVIGFFGPFIAAASMLRSGRTTSDSAVIALLAIGLVVFLIFLVAISYIVYRKLIKNRDMQKYTQIQIINEVIKNLPGLEILSVDKSKNFNIKSNATRALPVIFQVTKKTPLITMRINGEHLWQLQDNQITWTETIEDIVVHNYVDLFSSHIILKNQSNKDNTFHYRIAKHYKNDELPAGFIYPSLDSAINSKLQLLVNKADFPKKVTGSNLKEMITMLPDKRFRDPNFSKRNNVINFVITQQRDSWLILNNKIRPYQYIRIEKAVDKMLSDAFAMYRMLILIMQPLEIWKTKITESDQEFIKNLKQTVEQRLKEQTELEQKQKETKEFFTREFGLDKNPNFKK